MRFLTSMAIHGAVVLAVFYFSAPKVLEKKAPEPVVVFPGALPGPAVAGATPLRPSPSRASATTAHVKPSSPVHYEPTQPQGGSGGGGAPAGDGATDGGAASHGVTGADAVKGPVQPGGEYAFIARAPQRIEGEDAPAINATLLSSLRGSRGIVLVRLQLRADGSVASATIVRSTLPMMDEIVLRHVKTWHFEAPRIAGRAVSVQFLQPFSFQF